MDKVLTKNPGPLTRCTYRIRIDRVKLLQVVLFLQKNCYSIRCFNRIFLYIYKFITYLIYDFFSRSSCPFAFMLTLEYTRNTNEH